MFDGLADSELPAVASGLAYAQAGVGGEEGCSLQIVADASCLVPRVSRMLLQLIH